MPAWQTGPNCSVINSPLPWLAAAPAEALQPIRGFIFDVDGVLTDGSVWCTEAPDPIRVMNIKDGYALQHAVKCGYRLAVISGGKSEAAVRRLVNLGLEDIFMGVAEKLPVFEQLCQAWHLPPAALAYMGDDVPDMPILQRVGLALAPADCARDVRELLQHRGGWLTQTPGGKGAVREALETVLRAQNTWLQEHSHQW